MRPFTIVSRWSWFGAVALLGGLASVGAIAPASRSAPLARTLADLATEKMLDAFAASVPDAAGTFVAVRVLPHDQILLIAGSVSMPEAITAAIAAGQYADVYAALQQSATPETRVFIQDLNVDGLQPKAGDGVDVVLEHGRRTFFDGARSGHELSDGEYRQRFDTCDEAYARWLSVLIDALENPPRNPADTISAR